MSVKGIVFDIKKYSIHDGPGTRTTAHLKGCPLSCWWCHNPESQAMRPAILFRSERCIACGSCVAACPHGAVSVIGNSLVTDPSLCVGCGVCADVCPAEAREICGRQYSVDQLMGEFAKDEIFSRNGGGVTFSGGEPLLQPEFLLEALTACGEEGYHRCVDTCGFVQKKVILEIAKETDLFLYDIKHMDPAEHKKYTGVDNAVILDNLRAISEAGAAINIRFPFIPGVNTGDDNVAEMADFVSKLGGVTGVNILPYHTAAKGKHERWNMDYKLPKLLPPTANQTFHAQRIFEHYGLKVTIGG